MTTRVISAVLAGFAVLGLGLYGGSTGLFWAVAFAVVVTSAECARMVLPRFGLPQPAQALFVALVLGAFFGSFRFSVEPGLAFALALVVFTCLTLWLARGRVKNDDLWPALAGAAFGALYCGLFPLYAARLAFLPQGPTWFAYLLVVVFTGDTLALFAGRAFGARKFMPAISPNKTWAGSLGGLVGSGVGGTLVLARELSVDVVPALVASVVIGFAAQNGDLLVSLIKRVAGVKDSGCIMPGHGGLLDRLDGVFMACPLVYALSLWVG